MSRNLLFAIVLVFSMLLEPALQLWETFVPADTHVFSAVQRRGRTVLSASEAVAMGTDVAKLSPVWGQRIRHSYEPALQQYIDGFQDKNRSVVWTLREQLASAEVAVREIPGTGERSCKRAEDGRYRCEGYTRAWQYLGPDTRKFGGLDMPCVWAHPLPRGSAWVVRLKELPETDEIRLIEGLVDGAPRIRDGGQVVLNMRGLISPDKEQEPGLFRASGQKPQEGNGLKYRRWDVANGLQGGLEIQISARKDGQRWYCFDIYGTRRVVR